MQMIWHDHIATHGDVVFSTRSDCEGYQCSIDRIRCQKFSAPMRAECDKEQRIVGKDASESRWELWISAHEFFTFGRCSHRPAGAAAHRIEIKEKSLRARLALRAAKQQQVAEVGSRLSSNPCSSRPLGGAVRACLQSALRTAERLQGREAGGARRAATGLPAKKIKKS